MTSDEKPKRRWGFREWLRLGLGVTMLSMAALALYELIAGNRPPDAPAEKQFRPEDFADLAAYYESEGRLRDALDVKLTMVRQVGPRDTELWADCWRLAEQCYERNIAHGEHQRNILLGSEAIDLLVHAWRESLPISGVALSPARIGLEMGAASVGWSVALTRPELDRAQVWRTRRLAAARAWVENALNARTMAERAMLLATDDALRGLAEEYRQRVATEVGPELANELVEAEERELWTLAAPRLELLRFLEPAHPFFESKASDLLARAIRDRASRADRLRWARLLLEIDPENALAREVIEKPR